MSVCIGISHFFSLSLSRSVSRSPFYTRSSSLFNLLVRVVRAYVCVFLDSVLLFYEYAVVCVVTHGYTKYTQEWR